MSHDINLMLKLYLFLEEIEWLNIELVLLLRDVLLMGKATYPALFAVTWCKLLY